MNELRIIGVRIYDRIKEAGKTQKILSNHAYCINTRLGFHELSEDICSRIGFVLLELKGNAEDCEKLEKELKNVGGLTVKKMTFDLSK